jgi:hypothetical protein
MTGAEVARSLGYSLIPSVGDLGAGRVFATVSASCLLARSPRHLDGVVGRLVRRGGTASELLAGLPVIRPTTSAVPVRPRPVPLVPAVTTDVIAVLRGNIGEFRTRGCALNLLAQRTATEEFHGGGPAR